MISFGSFRYLERTRLEGFFLWFQRFIIAKGWWRLVLIMKIPWYTILMILCKGYEDPWYFDSWMFDISSQVVWFMAPCARACPGIFIHSGAGILREHPLYLLSQSSKPGRGFSDVTQRYSLGPDSVRKPSCQGDARPAPHPLTLRNMATLRQATGWPHSPYAAPGIGSPTPVWHRDSVICFMSWLTFYNCNYSHLPAIIATMSNTLWPPCVIPYGHHVTMSYTLWPPCVIPYGHQFTMSYTLWPPCNHV